MRLLFSVSERPEGVLGDVLLTAPVPYATAADCALEVYIHVTRDA